MVTQILASRDSPNYISRSRREYKYLSDFVVELTGQKGFHIAIAVSHGCTRISLAPRPEHYVATAHGAVVMLSILLCKPRHLKKKKKPIQPEQEGKLPLSS